MSAKEEHTKMEESGKSSVLNSNQNNKENTHTPSHTNKQNGPYVSYRVKTASSTKLYLTVEIHRPQSSTRKRYATTRKRVEKEGNHMLTRSWRVLKLEIG